jgi:flagellin-like hook-associated protein FlgL
MASNITLSAAVRQNLLALQTTASLMSDTQNRLATGKKVNSALDNPGSFFTSQALSNRAGDLNSLLDSIGQAQQVLKAADTGLTSLTKLVESAKSIAKQAQQAPQPGSTTYNAFTVTGNPVDETIGTYTGDVMANAVVAGAGDIVISVTEGSNNYTVTVDNADFVGLDDAGTVAAIQAEFDAVVGVNKFLVSTDGVGNGTITIDALNADLDFTITANTTTDEVGLTVDDTTDTVVASTSLLDNIGTSGYTLTVQVNGGANQVLTFGNGLGQISTLAELNTAIGASSGLASGGASNTALTFGVASSSSQNSIVLTSSNAALTTALGLTGLTGTTQGTAQVGTPNATRTSLESDYNNVLTQLDTLVKDSSYNGVNLLNGDDFKVVFNETGSSYLTITGVTFDTSGLGLAAIGAGTFQADANIDTEITKLDAALSTLRNQASKFGSNLTTVQIRQDFTKNLVNTLQTGADNLVLADTNAEGANLLALQTRQQLSSTALALSAQADQAVLRLF